MRREFNHLRETAPCTSISAAARPKPSHEISTTPPAVPGLSPPPAILLLLLLLLLLGAYSDVMLLRLDLGR